MKNTYDDCTYKLNAKYEHTYIYTYNYIRIYLINPLTTELGLSAVLIALIKLGQMRPVIVKGLTKKYMKCLVY